MSILIKNAHPDQIPGLIDFLQKANLPTSDLPSGLSGFTLAMDVEQIVGSAGMELMGKIGLLRSVAVAETHRNQKLGQQLFEAAMEYARKKQVQDVFLITETADLYFEKKGFRRVDREAVPVEILETKQFSALCPASAVVMTMNLD
jgi:amino-acid N-acetyltransferase